jgi:hypothetical protein
MVNTSSRHEAEGALRLWGAEEVFRVGQRVETVWRQASQAQQAAADSFDKSADSQDRARQVI